LLCINHLTGKIITVNSINSKTSWSIVNSTLGNSKKSKQSIKKLQKNNCDVTDPVEIANILNRQFIIPDSNSPVPDLTHIKVNPNSFFLLPTSPFEVNMIIGSLSNTNAAGVDMKFLAK